MNRNLLVFGLFLVILGLGLNFYLISLFGVLLMIPAVMSPRRVPPRPVAAAKGEPPKRTTSVMKEQVPPVPPMAEPQQVPGVPAPPPVSAPSQGYSPPLFPNSIFVPMMSSGYPPSPSLTEQKRAPERDELIEAGAMLALLKIILG